MMADDANELSQFLKEVEMEKGKAFDTFTSMKFKGHKVN